MIPIVLWTFMIPVPIAIIFLGIIPLRAKDAERATIWESALRGAAMLWFLALFFFVIPRFTLMFEDFGVELPGITARILHITDVRQPISWLALSLAEVLLASNIAMFVVLRQDQETTHIAKYISRASSALFAVTYSILFLSLALPLLKLLRDLG